MPSESNRRDADEGDIDLDTQELDAPESTEPLGFGPGEWASSVAIRRKREDRVSSGNADSAERSGAQRQTSQHGRSQRRACRGTRDAALFSNGGRP